MKASLYVMRPILAALEQAIAEQDRKWLAARLARMPYRWGCYLKREHARRGGLAVASANRWLLELTEQGGGRVLLSASDADLRAAAKEAAREAAGIVADLLDPVLARGRAVLALLSQLCGRWGVPSLVWPAGAPVGPAVARLCCRRWWLRALRRAHGRRGEGAAIVGGVVRRGLWPYASQDCVERRQEQRRRNAASLAAAVLEDRASGETAKLAEVVEGSVANPEVKRSELMVRIKGHDSLAHHHGWGAEFWTMTAPSRFHAQRITGACAEPNPNYGEEIEGQEGRKPLTPRDGQSWLCRVWARARAAWHRRGLVVVGLRTAEPHHDGCPHWHLVVYGPKRDLRYARRLLRIYILRDGFDEPGAKKHRFAYLVAKGGAAGARYAAKYVAKNINGAGMDAARDGETGRKTSDSVLRVDAWASAWGVRQFQFFGGAKVGIWRILRRFRDPVAVPGAALEDARLSADLSDWAGFSLACERGGLSLVKAAGRLTSYGDAAAARVIGVCEGARRAILPARDWVIHWAGKAAGAVGGFDLPRSCVNNYTGAANDKAADHGLPWIFLEPSQQNVDFAAATG